MKKYILIIVGLTSTVLAVIGAILPGLPTTIFLIIALWAFSQSSTKLHSWLSSIKFFKTALDQIENYQKHKAIPLKTKIIAQTFAWTSTILLLISPIFIIFKLISILFSLICSIVMFKIATKKDIYHEL